MASVGGVLLGGGWGADHLHPGTFSYPGLFGFPSMHAHSLHSNCCRPLYATGVSIYHRGASFAGSFPTGNVVLPIGECVRLYGQVGGGGRQRQEFRQPPGLEMTSDDQVSVRAAGIRSLPGSGGIPVDITTMMVRNLPRRVSLERFVAALDISGFADAYDYVYMPPYCQEDDSRKHAFVNFRTPEAAADFKTTWHKTQRFGTGGKTTVTIAQAVTQGFHDNVAKRKAAKLEMGFTGKRGYGLLILGPPSPDTVSISSDDWPAIGGEPSGPSDQVLGAARHEAASPSAPLETAVPMPAMVEFLGACRYQT